jgi:hypothetical protein
MQEFLGLDELRRALNGDAEFRIAARHWTAVICLSSGGDRAIMRIRDGEVVSLAPDSEPLQEWDMAIAAPGPAWRELLRARPRPFFQDFFPAMLHHGLEFRGDLQSLFAYYPAVRRMGDVMREVANG